MKIYKNVIQKTINLKYLLYTGMMSVLRDGSYTVSYIQDFLSISLKNLKQLMTIHQ